jgi:threonine synthase
MMFVSTHSDKLPVSFYQATLQGMPLDGGLFVPTQYPKLSSDTIQSSVRSTLTELGQIILSPYLTEIPATNLKTIIDNALNFPIPLIHLENNLYLLEVFHGPTLAFKDVGARFMANTLNYFLAKEDKHLTIIVATSGDTGSAIANAFYEMPNIDVYILYPSKKITFLQEQQITTLGGNIHALEVEGTFDDCQRLVKTALVDPHLHQDMLMTTANSINISRLLPQMIYHSAGINQLIKLGVTEAPFLSVPSGNFGNLTSAIYAKSLGFQVRHFIAATNINSIVPDYLLTDSFTPKPSQHTLSNAMDVGNPSNFERLLAFYQQTNRDIHDDVTGISITDEQTLAEIRNTYKSTGYLLDPHTAVGVAAARSTHNNAPVIITATAHPAKFPEVIKKALGIEPDMPLRLSATLDRKKQSQLIDTQYNSFKNILLHRPTV